MILTHAHPTRLGGERAGRQGIGVETLGEGGVKQEGKAWERGMERGRRRKGGAWGGEGREKGTRRGEGGWERPQKENEGRGRLRRGDMRKRPQIRDMGEGRPWGGDIARGNKK